LIRRQTVKTTQGLPALTLWRALSLSLMLLSGAVAADQKGLTLAELRQYADSFNADDSPAPLDANRRARQHAGQANFSWSVYGSQDTARLMQAPGMQGTDAALALGGQGQGHLVAGGPKLSSFRRVEVTTRVTWAKKQARDHRIGALVLATEPDARFFEDSAQAAIVLRTHGTYAIWKQGEPFIETRALPDVSRKRRWHEVTIAVTRGSEGLLFECWVDGKLLGAINRAAMDKPLHVVLGSWRDDNTAKRPTLFDDFSVDSLPQNLPGGLEG
jgi:hypothetical protein